MGRLGTGAGSYNKFVTLARKPQTTDDADGYWEPLTPPGAWAAITPQLGLGGRTTEYVVELRYHPQITEDARLVYTTTDYTLELLVRGVQNVNQDDTIMRLLCESITA
jgi:head-tail adaptor